PGSSTYNNGAYSVTSSGRDVWFTADAVHFLYQTWSGDFDAVVRVTSQQNTSAWAKASLMVRESLDANAKNVLVFLTPTNGARVQWRSTTGGSEADDPGVSSAQPNYWLRLIRRGNAFAGLGSSDGQHWVALGSQTVSMGTNVYIGIGQ